jgi:hypothetical protein
MKYAKPEINLVRSACAVIQSSTTKQQHVVRDNMAILATTAAYEADE